MTSRNRPPKLTSMHHKQTELGAIFLQHESDWVLADRFKDPSDERKAVENNVGLHDISYMTKLSLKADNVPETVANLYKQPRAKIGSVLNEGPGSLGEVLCTVLTSDEAMFLTRQSVLDAIRKQLNDSLAPSSQIVDVTSGIAGLYLIGKKSREVLTKLTELNTNIEDFPDSRVSHAEIHHVQCIIVHRNVAGISGYQIYFERAFGEYMWDIVLHAGAEFQMVPVGTKTMDMLGWR
jgi:heterotetrameric sarcosine oxidase gamma subunit